MTGKHRDTANIAADLRLLSIQQKRNVDLRKVLEYELGTLPLSLANYDGTLCKTQKSKLFQHLKSTINKAGNYPKIFDGMVLLQKLPPTLKTFGEISDYLLEKLLQGSARISIFVTDFNLKDSVNSIM